MLKEYKKMNAQQIQNHMGSELRRFRQQANIDSAGTVANHLGLGLNTLYNNENGERLINRITLINLFDLYGMKQSDRDMMLSLRELIVEKRKEERKGE